MKKLLFSVLAALLVSVPVSAQQIAAGNITATGDSVTAFIPPNTRSVVVQVVGGTGTLTFQGSVDGVNFVSLTATNQAGYAQGTTTTSAGVFGLPAMTVIRVYGTSVSATWGVTIGQGGAGGGGGGGGGGGSVTQGTSPWIVAGGGTAGSPGTAVLTVQGIASGTALAVGGAGTAGSPSGGVLTVNGGMASNGISAGTNRLPTLPAIVETGALPTLTDGRDAALYVNTNGGLFVTPTSGSFATDGTFDSAVPATGPAIGFRAETTTPSAMADGDLVYPWADTLGAQRVTMGYDPCTQIAKTVIPINISTATTTEITPSLAGAGNYYYVCSLNLVVGGADNVALVDDDSDGCGSVTAGMAGGTTAASGWNFAANGGLTFGNGMGTLFKTNGTNRVICMVTSAAVQLSGSITVVAAP